MFTEPDLPNNTLVSAPDHCQMLIGLQTQTKQTYLQGVGVCERVRSDEFGSEHAQLEAKEPT